MFDEIACPSCGEVNLKFDRELLRLAGNSMAQCRYCGKKSWMWAKVEEITEFQDNEVVIEDQLPSLPIGAHAYLINERHPRFLERCEIVNKKHVHYRVRFEDDMLLWIPGHWVIPDRKRNDHSGN